MKQLLSFAKTAAFLALMFFGSDQSNAQTPAGIAIAKYSPDKINYIGTDGDMLVFELRLDNLPSSGSILRIRDEHNTVIYEERIHSVIHYRRYKITRESMQKINFEVINKFTILKQSFNLIYKVEEKLEVTKA